MLFWGGTTSRECQGGDGQVPDTPLIMELIGDPGVEDKAPEGISGLVDSAQGLHKERGRAPRWDDLNDSLCNPLSKLGAERLLDLLIALPGRMVGAPRASRWKGRLGHRQLAAHDDWGDGVQRAQLAGLEYI